MIDQVKELKAIKYKGVAAFNGMINWQERRQILSQINRYKLLYISPELFQSKEVIEVLQNINLSLVVIDEAHCISQWGYDFRPDYLRIIDQIKLLKDPPILALTATASDSVKHDIKQALNRPNMKEIIYPIDRENIIIDLEKVNNEIEKKEMIIKLLTKHQVPTLIYFSSRKKCEEIAAYLTTHLNEQVAYYHGGLENSDRLMIQQQFMNNQLNIICCTAAFGMGINKKDIRLIIHYHLPLEIESYIQEIGRAGRDGKESVSVLLFNDNDIYLPLNIIENQFLTSEQIGEALKKIKKMTELPSMNDYFEKELEINEVQWRNLKFQLENHGMIKKNRIIKDHQIWLKNKNNIIELNELQELTKQNKLNQLIDWINIDGCLRKALYKDFQTTYKQPLTYCCSVCDFNLSKWKTTAHFVNERQDNNWKDKLANLLQVGDFNETS